MQMKKEKKREYLIVNATRFLSSGDFFFQEIQPEDI